MPWFMKFSLFHPGICWSMRQSGGDCIYCTFTNTAVPPKLCSGMWLQSVSGWSLGIDPKVWDSSRAELSPCPCVTALTLPSSCTQGFVPSCVVAQSPVVLYKSFHPLFLLICQNCKLKPWAGRHPASCAVLAGQGGTNIWQQEGYSCHRHCCQSLSSQAF